MPFPAWRSSIAGLRGRSAWTVTAAAPVCLAFIVWAVWSFAFDGGGNETADKLAWSAVLALLVGLIATTGLLLARRRALVGLAAASGGLAAAAASLSIAGIWTEPDSDAFVKAVAVLWILAALAYFLVPVVQRFTSAGVEKATIRVLAELDGVELVASRSPLEGVAAPAPAAGEYLVLRRRQAGT